LAQNLIVADKTLGFSVNFIFHNSIVLGYSGRVNHNSNCSLNCVSKCVMQRLFLGLASSFNSDCFRKNQCRQKSHQQTYDKNLKQASFIRLSCFYCQAHHFIFRTLLPTAAVPDFFLPIDIPPSTTLVISISPVLIFSTPIILPV